MTRAPLNLADFRERFNAELVAVMAERTAAAAEFDPAYGELLRHLSAFLARGGKRLRPYLVYLSYTGSDGPAEYEPALLKTSIASELYHNAWLIHDDLIDRDLVRYGGPNIAGLYRAQFTKERIAGGRHLADAMALIAGDINANLATELILTSPFAESARLAAARANIDANFEVFAGETLDVLMPTRDATEITPERLLKLYQAKTAAYSFRAPLLMGALLAGAPVAAIRHIPDFAEPLGVAFQLADDLLGTFGNEQQLGKSVLSDLREGKRTVLHMTALHRADPADRRILETIAGNPKAGYHHLATVRTIYERCGARKATEDLAGERIDQALAVLPQLEFSASVEGELSRLASYLINRPA